MSTVTILPGDCRQTLSTLPAESVQCCITSPPYYGLRDYGCAEQIGLEQSPEAFVAELVAVFREVRRVLRSDGTLWLNLGDSYANDRKWGGSSGGKHAKALHGSGGKIGRCRHLTGLPAKNLVGIPWRVAFALQADGWILRSDIIWHKPNPMPESITDRPTKSHEYLLQFAKQPGYFNDADAIAENAVSDHDSGNSFQGRQGGAAHLPMSGGRGGQAWTREGRPQLRRAMEIAREAGLTQAHFDAIRACGLTDTGKNRATQAGTGRNDPGVQALADHAKSVLKGYYREFLSGGRKCGVPGYHQGYTTNHTGLDGAPRGGRRNKRSVWTVATRAYREAHFAVFPPALIRPCVLAGSRVGDTILDPFGGSGTTGMVALEEGRKAVLCELNPAYLELICRRCSITPSFVFAESEVVA